MSDAFDDLPGMHIDPTSPLTATGNLRRRMRVNHLLQGTSIFAAVAAIVILAILIFGVIQRGASAVSWDFLTQAPNINGGGGIEPMIVGTVEIVAVAALIAAPLGVLIAIYLVEFAGTRTRSVMRLTLDLMNGLPSIVVAVFVFGLLEKGHPQTGFAGSVALAILMLPMISRSSQEVLRLVPQGRRDAADALGVSRWRTVIGVLLPSALGGILTGTILAVARAAGETAPLLLCDSLFNPGSIQLNPGAAIPNIPVLIFTSTESGGTQYATAWGAALVLLVAILITNVSSRYALARSKAKAGS
jgi:phosphate transport system permease protein